MVTNRHPFVLHPEAPDAAAADQHLYAAWRYSILTADDVVALHLQGLSVAAILQCFRDEWRRAREEAIDAQLHAGRAPGTLTHPGRR